MGMGRKFFIAAVFTLSLAGWAAAQQPPAAATNQPMTLDQVVNRIIQREHQEVAQLRAYSPIVETYIQDLRPGGEMGLVPEKDHYYLGQAVLSRGMVDRSMLARKGNWFRKLNPVSDLSSVFGNSYVPEGFLQMIYVDPVYFDRKHYHFDYVRREFLGSVRCLVFDVTPLPKSGNGRFKGRIWVEDQDYTIVRFNGVFVPVERTFGFNLHFDSWRVNVAPGLWVPAYIYSAESDLHDFPYGSLRFKSQTRLWGYDLGNIGHEQEFSQLTVESSKPIQDQADASLDASPIQAEREWQREGEDNVLDRLQQNGLLAVPGPVDKVMETVVNNLEVTNNLDIQPDVRCRVLLTSTLESFTIGHTIVLSRGLLDVLPDEASLATMLAHELAGILVGQQKEDAYAFNDETMVSTVDTLRRLSFHSNPNDEETASKKALALLQNSPYKNQLGNAGLFLKQLAAEQKSLPGLISPNLGNRVYLANALMQAAPELRPAKLDQIAALPLGARIIVNPWNDDAELARTKPVPLLSERDKMPLGITPFFPYLTRYAGPATGAAPADASKADLSKKDSP